MDEIKGQVFITGFATQCHIGCTAMERKTEQPVLIDIRCLTDMGQAVCSDQREDCVDYCELHRIAAERAQACSYKLLEALAYVIATDVLANRRVIEVTVTIRKPYKLPGCKDAGIELCLHRKEVGHGP